MRRRVPRAGAPAGFVPVRVAAEARSVAVGVRLPRGACLEPPHGLADLGVALRAVGDEPARLRPRPGLRAVAIDRGVPPWQRLEVPSFDDRVVLERADGGSAEPVFAGRGRSPSTANTSLGRWGGLSSPGVERGAAKARGPGGCARPQDEPGAAPRSPGAGQGSAAGRAVVRSRTPFGRQRRADRPRAWRRVVLPSRAAASAESPRGLCGGKPRPAMVPTRARPPWQPSTARAQSVARREPRPGTAVYHATHTTGGL